MVLHFGAALRVQPYFGYRDASRLRISARVLRQDKPRFEGRGDMRTFFTMLRQFASHEVAGVPVRLEIRYADGSVENQERMSDKEGFVHFDVTLSQHREAPAHTEWETVAFHWDSGEGLLKADGHVLFPGRHAKYGIISDIDDTVMETGITGGLRQLARNWRRVLAQLPRERELVGGAEVFYDAIGGGQVRDEHSAEDHAGERQEASHNPFFYISSSPWNLFSYLVAFQRSRALPLGPMALRDWGLNRETFGSSSHGAHKAEALDAIIGFYPDLSFALIGDDTQGDLIAFGAAVKRHPDRVRAVFIRRAGEPFNVRELEAKKAVEAAGVPLWLGDDYATGRDFLAKLDLESDSAAQAIVKTVEKAGKAKTRAAT